MFDDSVLHTTKHHARQGSHQRSSHGLHTTNVHTIPIVSGCWGRLLINCGTTSKKIIPKLLKNTKTGLLLDAYAVTEKENRCQRTLLSTISRSRTSRSRTLNPSVLNIALGTMNRSRRRRTWPSSTRNHCEDDSSSSAPPVLDS